MPRTYKANFKNVSVSAQQDFFEMLAASGVPIEILGWTLEQETKVGDANEAMWRLTTTRGVGSVTSGSGGSTPTGQPSDDADTAAAATIEANNTTKMVAGSGSLEVEEAHAWNIRSPYTMWYPPEARPFIRGGARWVLTLETTPAAATVTNGTIYWMERG